MSGISLKLPKAVLYDLTTYPGEELLFRGYELDESHDCKAMVCQEWAVVLGSNDAHRAVDLRKYR